MSAQPFGERFVEAIESRLSHVVVGLDPEYDSLPLEVRDAHPVHQYESAVQMKAACYREFLGGFLMPWPKRRSRSRSNWPTSRRWDRSDINCMRTWWIRRRAEDCLS